MLKSLRRHKKVLIHPHIIRLFHYFDDEENFYLIHELVDRNFNDLFIKRKKMIEREAFVFFSQITLALDFLHKNSILHKRLNFETILLDSQNNVKLSDFGLILDFSNMKNLSHLSPETLKTRLFSPENDVWALGVILYRMIHGQMPFKNNELRFSSYVSDECIDLITCLLKKDPEERITINKIFSHSWIKKFEEVYKIQLKNYVFHETNQKINELFVKRFVPSFTTKNFDKRNSVVFDHPKPDILSGFYNRISFADEGFF